LTTIILSSLPDLTASVSVPRLAAIEHPLGRPFGQPGDPEGQMAVLRATLAAGVKIDTPGNVEHLPFEWPESTRKAHTKPPQPPPIARHLLRRPWLLPKLFARDIPA
jgi:D-proline reductase (dithiol) PrdB